MARVLLLLRGCDEGWLALVQPAMGNDVSRQRVPMSVVEGAVVGLVQSGAAAGEAAADATGACVASTVPIFWSSARPGGGRLLFLCCVVNAGLVARTLRVGRVMKPCVSVARVSGRCGCRARMAV